MSAGSRRAFAISLVLHGGFFAVLAIAMLMDWLRPRPEPEHVFTLVSPSERVERAVEPDSEPVPDEAEQEPELTIPEIDPVQAVPDPPTPAPRTEPAPSQPEPEQPKRLTREEFVREYGQPRETVSRPRPRRSITPPTIDVSQVREELRQINRRRSASSAVSEDELMRWRNAVYQRINRAWEEPGEVSGRDLSAEVQFDVASDGTVSNFRFVRSSGNEIFDRSISRALEQVRRVDPPPGGSRFSPRLTFQKVSD